MPEGQPGLIEDLPAHGEAFAASPLQVASPDPTAENDVLAEQNHILKRRLSKAVTVANSCAFAVATVTALLSC